MFKQIFKISIYCLILFSCSDKVIAQNTDHKGLWNPISLGKWKEVPAINNRIANEDDVNVGRAVYYIEGDYENHKPYKINLPKLAYLTDFDTKQKELVVIIQIEETPKGIVVGYRNLNGGNGAGLLNEFEMLNDKEVEKLLK